MGYGAEVYLVMLIGVMAFPLFWCGIVVLISFLGGWRKLADFYGSDEDPVRETRRLRSLSIRGSGRLPSNYNKVVTLGVSQSALFISVMFIFRPGHSPLSIPFSDISIEKNKGLFGRFAFLSAAKAPDITLMMSMKDIDWIESVFGELSSRT